MGRDIITNLIANDRASGPIEKVGKAAERSAAKLDDMSAADQRLALELERSQVRVEKATRAAASAQERYGRDSLQAREATVRLKAAQLDLADAEEKVKKHTPCEQLDCVAKNSKKASEGTDQAAGAMGRLGSSMASVLPTLGRFAGLGLSVTAALGPAALGIVSMATAATRMATAMAPAIASLPGMAAGALLVERTLKLTGPAMASALSPVTRAWLGMQAPVGRLATQGLPQLARQFVRVNFPVIGAAMKEIARQTNSVVLAVGKWVNSAAGQSTVRDIVSGTLGFTRQLAQILPGVATSFLNMVGRAAGPGLQAIGGAGPMLDRLATGAEHLFNSVGKGDVVNAWSRIGGAIGGVLAKVGPFAHLVLDVGNYLNDNRAKVKGWSDVLAGAGITIGILTGGVVPVLIGGLTLLANHWDTVKGAVSGAVTWFRHSQTATSAVTTVVGLARGAVADLSSWWHDHLLPSLQDAAKRVMPAIHDAIKQVTTAFHDHRDIVKKAEEIISALGVVLTEAVIPAVSILASLVIKSLGPAFTGLVTVLDRAVFPAIKGIIGGVLELFGTILDGGAKLFGWVPGVGPKLKEAAAKFDGFRNDVNKALGGIQDQTVNVGVKLSASPSAIVKSQLGAFGHAAGGLIRGPGGPRDDQVPAMLSAGEYVVNAAATQRHRGLLEAINAGRYAFGGLVMHEQLTGLRATQQAELGYARKLAAAMPVYAGGGGGGHRPGGLSAAEWYIISRESGGRTTAQNPTSTAFGLGQLLYANRVHYGRILGVSPSTTDYAAQLDMFRMYVHDRYGTAANAAAFWAAHHWYGNGGVIREPILGIGMRTGQRYGFGENGPETVIPGRVSGRLTQGGTTVVRYETTVNVNATGSDIELENKLIRVLVKAGQRGRLRQLGITP